MLSLNDSLWIILVTRQNGYVVTKVKWGKTKWKISLLYSFKKGNFSLVGGAVAPSVPPQLRHWHCAGLYSPVTSSVYSSYEVYAKGGSTNDLCNGRKWSRYKRADIIMHKRINCYVKVSLLTRNLEYLACFAILDH